MLEVKKMQKNTGVNRFRDCMMKNILSISHRWKMHAKYALGNTSRSGRNSYYATC